MIREMKYRDIEAVNALLTDAFADEYTEMNIDTKKRLAHMKRGYTLEKAASFFFKNYDKFLDFYVYEEEGSIRGCLRIVRQSETTFNFATIAIDKGHRRRRIALNLQEYCVDLCQKRGGKYITLAIKEENLPSLRLVGKSGLAVYDENYMYLLKNPPQYRDRPVCGFRTLKRKDYTKVGELEKAIMREEVVEIEGIPQRSLLTEFTHVLRGIFFGEKFHEYVLEEENRIIAYAKISYFVDGSSSMVLMVHGEDYGTLKDFTEKVLYCDAKERLRTVLGKDQTLERKILIELGFEEYLHFYAHYKTLRD